MLCHGSSSLIVIEKDIAMCLIMPAAYPKRLQILRLNLFIRDLCRKGCHVLTEILKKISKQLNLLQGIRYSSILTDGCIEIIIDFR